MQIDRSTRVLVTGASRGIGRAVTEAFAGRDCTLGLIARPSRDLEALTESIDRSTSLPSNVADKDQIGSAVTKFCEKEGGIDLLVANAGIAHYAPAQEMPIERVEEMIEVNYWGTVYAVEAVLPHMLSQKKGHIVIVSSAAAGASSTMPLDTYLWPSKCKVGWGAGELLRVLVRHRPEDLETIERAYRVAERVAVFTFIDNQLPHGGWPWMHYPLSEQIPEMAFSYKPLKDKVWPPPEPIAGSQTIFLSSEEITGEFLGELKAIEQGVAAWLEVV